jgi:hypothetical protein
MAVAPGVDDVKIGDRVACAGAPMPRTPRSTYVPRNLVVPVPRRRTGEYVGFDEAAFTTVGAHRAARRSGSARRRSATASWSSASA